MLFRGEPKFEEQEEEEEEEEEEARQEKILIDPPGGTVPAPSGPGRVRVLSRRHWGPPERPIMRVGCKNACAKSPFKY